MFSSFLFFNVVELKGTRCAAVVVVVVVVVVDHHDCFSVKG